MGTGKIGYNSEFLEKVWDKSKPSPPAFEQFYKADFIKSALNPPVVLAPREYGKTITFHKWDGEKWRNGGEPQLKLDKHFAYGVSTLTKVDLTKKKEKRMAYSTGDIVRILDTENARQRLEDDDLNDYFRVDEEYKVKDGNPDSDGDIKLYEEDETDWHYFNKNYVEIVRSAEAHHGLREGDEVRCIAATPLKPGSDRERGGSGWEKGKVFIIDHFTCDGDILWPTDGSCGVYREFVEKVTNNNSQEGENTMANAKDVLKLANTDDTTRTLRKYDLEYSDGSGISSAGKEMLLEMLWNDKRSEIAKKLVEAEQAVATQKATDEAAVAPTKA